MKKGPITYTEKLLWIRNKVGAVVPLHLNPTQRWLHREKYRHVQRGGKRRFLILKARRQGVTTWEQACSYFLTATVPGQYALTLADVKEKAELIFQMVLLFYNRSPIDIRPFRKTDSQKRMNFTGLGSMFYIGTAGAESTGHGATLQRVHGSEVARWKGDVENLMSGLTEAASHGEVVLETTAYGVGNWFHTTWVAAEASENEWCPIFIPWWVDLDCVLPLPCDPEEFDVTAEEEELIERVGLSLNQIAWRRDKKLSLRKLFPQEYPEDSLSAFLASGIHFFDLMKVNELVKRCVPPVEVRDNGAIHIWKKPESGHHYVAGGDVGEGLPGGDPSGIGILDRETCEQVASLHGRWRPEVFAHKAAKLATEYNKAVLAIERNNHGHSTINTLANTLHYPRLYRMKLHDGDGRNGWVTSTKTRPIMLDDLAQSVEDETIKVNDRIFLNECTTFEDTGKGKYEARQGFHDDSIVKWAIAWQIRKQRGPRITIR